MEVGSRFFGRPSCRVRFRLALAAVFVIFASAVWFGGLADFLEWATLPDRDALEIRLIPHDKMVMSGLQHSARQGEPSPKLLPELLFRPLGVEANFTIVTAVSPSYFDRVLNLIGSIHYYEPNVRIIAVDLGLSARQQAELLCLKQVEIHQLDYDSLPPHIKILSNYSWKTIALSWMYDAFPAGVFYLDSGEELWKSLDEVVELLKLNGYFFTVQNTKMNMAHRDMAAWLGVEEKVQKWSHWNHFSGGIVGFMKHALSDAGKARLEWSLGRLRECGLHAECIAPNGATLKNHKYDQSALSLILSGNFSAHLQWRWWADWGIVKTDTPEHLGGPIQFFSRRHHCPKPYQQFAAVKEECSSGAAAAAAVVVGQHVENLKSFFWGSVVERKPWRCPEKLNAIYIIVYWVAVVTIGILLALGRRSDRRSLASPKEKCSLVGLQQIIERWKGAERVQSQCCCFGRHKTL